MRFTLVLSLLLGSLAAAQAPQEVTCDCAAELDFVYQQLQTSISYQQQSQQQALVTTAYATLQQQIAKKPIAVFTCYQYLNRLVHTIKDNHNEVYGKTQDVSYQQLTDSTFLGHYRTTDAAHWFPFTERNVDSLEKALRKEPLEAIAGIYHYKDYVTVGLFPVAHHYEGVVLASKIPSWQIGERMITLVPIPDTENRFYHTTGKFIDKTMIMGTDTFVNGTLPLFGWSKVPDTSSFYNAPYPDETFKLSSLNPQTQYLKLGSFSGSNSGKKAANDFYKSIKKQLNAPNLIVDLRNNGGGSDQSSKPFLKLLQQYHGNCYVLINFKTMSNAEQFVVKLREKRKLTLLGDASNGRISYGRNTPKTQTSPSGWFTVHFTDMNNHEYLPYENKGIVPDIRLHPSQSFITQTLAIIASGS